MEFISRITEAADQELAVAELSKDVNGYFDLALLFVSPWQPYDSQEIYEALRGKIKAKNFISCTCAGIVGSEREIEGRPAASLLLARLPAVTVVPFYINQVELEGLNSTEAIYNFFDVYPNEKPSFVVLPDPYAVDTVRFIRLINQFYQGSAVIGGLASAASGPGENVIILNGEVYREGLIGFALKGAIEVHTVVSQGCRPWGPSFVVTKSKDNVIHELGGRPFYKVLEEVIKSGTDYDRHLAREAIFVGIVINEYKSEFKKGDFLIRPVMAVDPDTGAGAIGDYISVGQTIQFHLRDAKTATEDLNELLILQKNIKDQTPQGALVFSCNGRGMGLFKEPNHDIKLIQHYLGPVPAAGFFCAGEIGPVGRTNFLHGFTNSMGLFYAK